MRTPLIFTLSLFLFLLPGCVVRYYNTPFIDLSETLRLRVGFKSKEVLTFIGDPLFVSYGDSSRQVWVYQVRAADNRSGRDEYDDVVPVKKSREQRVGPVVHMLQLEFYNDTLKAWQQYCPRCDFSGPAPRR